MRLLVTGGAGFIGSHFIRYWLTHYPNDHIVNLDKLTYASNQSSIATFDTHDNYTFIKGDICNALDVNRAMRECDIVVHFAAESHVDRSIDGPQVFIQANIVGTQILLDAALKHAVKRFHHISTDEVFGTLEIGSPETFSEKSPYNPRSPYAASKAASDHLVRAYYTTYNLPVTITNCSNNYGAYQNPEKFLPRMITRLIDNEPILLYGDGNYIRDWLYVDDHVRAIGCILQNGAIGETYMVGGLTQDITNYQLALKLLQLFNKKDESYIKFVTDRPGHDRRYAVNWNKIHATLNWKPHYSFDQGLNETIRWYQRNEWWWRPLKKQAETYYSTTPK